MSRDGGRTWTPLARVPGPHPLGRAQFLDSRTGFVVGHFGRLLWRTTDGGRSWTPIPAPTRGVGAPARFDHADFWTPAAGVAVARGFGGGYLTTSGGRSWKRLSVPGALVGTLTGPVGLPPDLRRGGYPGLDYACFAAGGAGWVVTITEPPAVFASRDGGSHWQVALPPAMLHAGTASAQVSAWLAGCRGTQAWVEVTQTSYRPGGGASYDLLHTSDSGRTWRDVLRIPDGTAIPRLKLPLSPGALTTSPLPAGLTLIPEPLALTSASGGWLTLVTSNGGLALAATADAGQHWQIHWFPPPRHAPRTAPASPSGLPAGLPWLATTATDSRHAWVLFGSTNGSGASYLYATSDGGATWTRIATFS